MRKRIILIGIAASLFFLFLFFHSLIFSIDKPRGSHDDGVYNYFILENGFSKLSTFDFAHLFDTRMFYPHQQTLAYSDSMLVGAALGLPFYLLTKNPIIASHMVLLLYFFLSFLAMYVFVYYLTKNTRSAMLAGLIYIYNPYVFSHIFHFSLCMLVFFPLIFLLTEQGIKKVTYINMLGLALLFFLQLVASFYYTIFIGVLWPIYFLIRIRQEKCSIKHFLSLKVILAIILLAAGAFLYLRPYIQVKNAYVVHRDIAITSLLSAQSTDFLFTSKNNVLYGWMIDNKFFRSWRDPYTAIHYTEHSLFPGIIVYAFLISAIYLFFTKRFGEKERPMITSLFIILVLTILFSFGPFFERKIPAPYLLLYKFVPFVDSIRAISRFMVLGYFFLAVIASFAWKYYAKRLKQSAIPIIFFILVFLISLEYFPVLPKPFVIAPQIENFYAWLSDQLNINVIVELPIANGLLGTKFERSNSSDAQYLFYGLYHNKKMVNGYNSFIPPDAVDLGDKLTIHFPTKAKINNLKSLGVNMIIVHLEEYENFVIANNVVESLRKIGLKEVYSQGTIRAFKI